MFKTVDTPLSILSRDGSVVAGGGAGKVGKEGGEDGSGREKWWRGERKWRGVGTAAGMRAARRKKSCPLSRWPSRRQRRRLEILMALAAAAAKARMAALLWGDAGGADERGDDVQVAALPLMPTALQETMASPRREEWCVAANSAMAWGEIVGVSGRNS